MRLTVAEDVNQGFGEAVMFGAVDERFRAQREEWLVRRTIALIEEFDTEAALRLLTTSLFKEIAEAEVVHVELAEGAAEWLLNHTHYHGLRPERKRAVSGALNRMLEELRQHRHLHLTATEVM